jgi:hypothetical protein
MRFRRRVPGAPVAVQEFFDKGHTHPKQVGKDALGAEPPLIGVENLLA